MVQSSWFSQENHLSHLSAWDWWQTLSRIHSILISTLYLFTSGLQRHPKVRRTKDLLFPSICSWKSQGLGLPSRLPVSWPHICFSQKDSLLLIWTWGICSNTIFTCTHTEACTTYFKPGSFFFFCGNKEYIHILKV